MKIRLLIVSSLFLPAVTFAAFDHDLYFGTKNQEVIKLQDFLKSQTLYSGPVTGGFFSLTKEAVQRFQQREGIVPASGYFGPVTRKHANAVHTPEVSVRDTLLAQIKQLQEQLKKLQENSTPTATSSQAVVPTPTPPSNTGPVFSVKPYVKQAGFLTDPSLGARYPYKVLLDWTIQNSGLTTDTVLCAPLVKSAVGVDSKTAYFPESKTNYTCGVDSKDASGNITHESVAFSSPEWVSVYGTSSMKFPEIETTPLKLGNFSIYNGTGSSALFANFELLLTDAMESVPNRGQKVYFMLRDGVNSTDPLISKTEFTLLSANPQPANISVLNFPFDVTVKSGEERQISLWVEQFKYVKSGNFILKTTKINTVSSGQQTPLGGFTYILTREPPL